jgi:integrase/recombinase XerC
MRYVLQDAADRLGFEDMNIEEIPWHELQPEDVIALVATLRRTGTRRTLLRCMSTPCAV